jgi:hypothetical protein
MTQPRSKIVNTDVTRWYLCISRCVRPVFRCPWGQAPSEATPRSVSRIAPRSSVNTFHYPN